MAIVLLVGCERPDLVIKDPQVTRCGPDQQTGGRSITYTFTIENRDYDGNLFVKPGSVSDRIHVQAWSSNDNVLGGGDTAAGGTSFAGSDFGSDNKLMPGESIEGSFTSSFTLSPDKPNLVLVVDPPTSEQLGAQAGADPIDLAQATGLIREYNETNNQNSTPIGRCIDFDITCTLVSGINTLALPYNRQSGLMSAQDLMNDINAVGGPVVSIQRYDKQMGQWQTYSGGMGPGFNLSGGEGLLVEISSDVDYRIFGSHNPSLTLSLDVGKNFIALPYHTTVADAQQLMTDIGSGVVNVQSYNRASGSWDVFSGAPGETPFQITPCEAYMVEMNTTVPYIPSHY